VHLFLAFSAALFLTGNFTGALCLKLAPGGASPGQAPPLQLVGGVDQTPPMQGGGRGSGG
jgi:hypothetical protein